MNSHQNIVTKTFTTATIILSLTLFASNALAWDREKAKTFALLPEGSTNSEALAVDSVGNIYASTFLSGEIHAFSAKGNLLSSIKVTPSSGMLTDLAFHPVTNALLVIDFGGKKVLEVNPVTGTATTFSDIPGGEGAGPNVLTFDAQGNVYVSDSFQGIVWRIPAMGGVATPWVNHALLTTSGFPPFGANGIAFNNDYSMFYIANTGEDTIVQVAVDALGNAATPEVLVNGINGPDGIIVDQQNNILIAANQSNQIVVIDPTGKAIAVLGDFNGITSAGVVNGLLMPSDLVKFGNSIYVTNFALDVAIFGLTQNYTTQYVQQVKRHSIVRISYEKHDAMGKN